MATRVLGLLCLISMQTVSQSFLFWPMYTQRTAGYFEDPCGPTLARLRQQGVRGLPNSIYIPPPRRPIRRRPANTPALVAVIPPTSPADNPFTSPTGNPITSPAVKRPSKPVSSRPQKPAPAKRPAARPKPAPAKRPAGRPKPAPAKRPAARPKPAPAKRPATRPKPAPAKRPAARRKAAPAKRPPVRPKPAPRQRPAARPDPPPANHPAARPSDRRLPARRPPPQPAPFDPYYGPTEPIYTPRYTSRYTPRYSPRYTPYPVYPDPFSRPMEPWLAALLDLDVADVPDVPVTTPRPTPRARKPLSRRRVPRQAVMPGDRERYNCYCESHWDCNGPPRARGGRYDPQCDNGYGLVCCCHPRY